MRFCFIEQHVGTFPVRLMCRVLEVSPSGFYAWRARPESGRALGDRQLLADVRRLQSQHQGRYGSPRCQRRSNFPQKWRSKVPHFVHRSIGLGGAADPPNLTQACAVLAAVKAASAPRKGAVACGQP